MRIAYVSFEYPPDNALGGIGTYVAQAARQMARRGHQVEVFAARQNAACAEERQGVHVNWCQESSAGAFRDTVAPVFSARHAVAAFDVVEGPEYNADALEIKNRFPQLPLVVKLHTPTLLLAKAGGFFPAPLSEQVRNILRALRIVTGAWRRGQRSPRPHVFATWWRRMDYLEQLHARQAEVIASPSRDLIRYAENEWRLARGSIRHIPNLYVASPEFLRIPIDTENQRVGFFGRLEQRKGVLTLAAAIPQVLERLPQTRFRFVGRDSPLPSGRMAADVIRERVGAAAASVEFRGVVPPAAIPAELAEVDVCVFPSIWENFPNVCLEAMAAGRGIIGSSAGGMADMLADDAGLALPPEQPRLLAEAIIALLTDPERRRAFGRQARARLQREYHPDRIGALMEQCYQSAIDSRRTPVRPLPGPS